MKSLKRVDSHQHFWNYKPQTHPWITDEMALLKRDFSPGDLLLEFNKNGIEGSVAVQAEQTLKETLWLLELAHNYHWILGVVGWVDLRDPRVEAEIDGLREIKQFKGVRHVLQGEPDDAFLFNQQFNRGIDLLTKAGLTYDILIYEGQLPAAIEFVKKHPDQKFILDHAAKPNIKFRGREPWSARLRELARSENVYCKISGLVTEADWSRWTGGDFSYYLETALEAFSPSRLLFGSDWPVCLLAADYARVIQITEDYFSKLSPSERDLIYHKNARRFYGL